MNASTWSRVCADRSQRLNGFGLGLDVRPLDIGLNQLSQPKPPDVKSDERAP